MDLSRLARYLNVFLILVTASLVGCDPSDIDSFIAELPNEAAHNGGAVQNSSVNHAGQLTRPAIIIGSFNIQSFGQTKMGKPEVMTR